MFKMHTIQQELYEIITKPVHKWSQCWKIQNKRYRYLRGNIFRYWLRTWFAKVNDSVTLHGLIRSCIHYWPPTSQRVFTLRAEVLRFRSGWQSASNVYTSTQVHQIWFNYVMHRAITLQQNNSPDRYRELQRPTAKPSNNFVILNLSSTRDWPPAV